MDNKDKLVLVFREVFGEVITSEEISELSQNTFSDWDSLNHLNVIISIENKFDLDILPEDMVNLNSFEKIYQYLENIK
jgi:acyl carrier protein